MPTLTEASTSAAAARHLAFRVTDLFRTRSVELIEDGGPGWDDPFAGYGPAHGEDLSRGGMGLWLARQLCDHVDISGDVARDGGVRVRLTTLLR